MSPIGGLFLRAHIMPVAKRLLSGILSFVGCRTLRGEIGGERPRLESQVNGRNQ
jgi:hypothetical protein